MATSRLSAAVYTPNVASDSKQGSSSRSSRTLSNSSSSDEGGNNGGGSGATTPSVLEEPRVMAASAPRFKWETDSWLNRGEAWDLSGNKELSNLVKAGTAEAHRTVEASPMVSKILRATLPLDAHIKFLVMLYQIYDALELALAEHAAHGRLARIYNPSVLSRADNLSEDITFFLGLSPAQDWRDHPTAKPLLARPPSALVEYVERIRSLSKDDGSLPSFKGYTYPPPPAEAWLLLAHAYVRYLGDLNGGQTLKGRVAKAYDLDVAGMDGLRFFDFEGKDGSMATAAELSRLSGTFKKGMDATGDELSPFERAAFLQEANHAFELNMRLFASLEETDDVSAQPLPASKAQMPAPSSDKFAKASTYMERRDPQAQAVKKNASATSAAVAKSGTIRPWMLWVGVCLPLYLIIRVWLPQYLA